MCGAASAKNIYSIRFYSILFCRAPRYSNAALVDARAKHDVAEEEERAAFAAAVADWRKGTGPVAIERERGTTREGEAKPELGGGAAAKPAPAEDDTENVGVPS